MILSRNVVKLCKRYTFAIKKIKGERRTLHTCSILKNFSGHMPVYIMVDADGLGINKCILVIVLT